MSDVVDLYAALRDDEAWWGASPSRPPVGSSPAARTSPPAGLSCAWPGTSPGPLPSLDQPIDKLPWPEAKVPGAPADTYRGSLPGVESQLALEALGALVADAHLRRQHWDLAQQADRRHDSRSCLQDCLAVLAIDPRHREARKLGAKAARELRQWEQTAALLAPLLHEGEPSGILDWDRIVAATVAGDPNGVAASVARLGLDPRAWQHPDALILVMLDGRAQVARRIGPASAEILSIAAGDRPQHAGDVVAFDPTPLRTGPTPSGITIPDREIPDRDIPDPPVPGPGASVTAAGYGIVAASASESPSKGLAFAAIASRWPPPPPGAVAAPWPPPPHTFAGSEPIPATLTGTVTAIAAEPFTQPIAAAGGAQEQGSARPKLSGAGPSGGFLGADLPTWPTFRTLAILASGARQAWIVRGSDPGFEAWEDTVHDLRKRGWVLRRVPALDLETDDGPDDRLGVVALPGALDPADVREVLLRATSAWAVAPGWEN